MTFLSRFIDMIGMQSPLKIILTATLAATLVSVILVGCTLVFFPPQLRLYIFFLSVIMPVLLTPPILLVVVKLVMHLRTYRSALQREIEENRKKDLLLFEQERFAVMGEILSNISHQWRQPLNTINLTVLSARLSDANGGLDNDALDKAFETIEQNTLHLSETIEDFRSFFQNKAPTKMVALRQIIYELNRIISPVLKAKNIDLKIHWNDDTIHRLELATAISQVLLNLINNAKDALDPRHQHGKQIVLTIEALAESVNIAVNDNGPGIDPAIRAKVFDPYFTTKGTLKGSGIGLHMSRQIIDKIFHGTLVLDDASATTLFRITLPYSDQCRLSD